MRGYHHRDDQRQPGSSPTGSTHLKNAGITLPLRHRISSTRDDRCQSQSPNDAWIPPTSDKRMLASYRHSLGQALPAAPIQRVLAPYCHNRVKLYEGSTHSKSAGSVLPQPGQVLQGQHPFKERWHRTATIGQALCGQHQQNAGPYCCKSNLPTSD